MKALASFVVLLVVGSCCGSCLPSKPSLTPAPTQAPTSPLATPRSLTVEEEEETPPAPAEPVTTTLTVEVEVEVPVGVAGVSVETLAEYLTDTTDVGALIAVLDRDWETSYDEGHRGEWSGAGTVMECQAVGWTDFHGEVPSGVQTVRREGGWGVYLFEEDYETPFNTAGRWICVSGEVEVVPPEEVRAEAVVACEVPDLEGMSVQAAVDAMDVWFEEAGWEFGGSFAKAKGDTVPADSVFWTNMGESFALPSYVTAVAADGNWGVFITSEPFEAPSGGRYVVCP